jgi:hypothetical protein
MAAAAPTGYRRPVSAGEWIIVGIVVFLVVDAIVVYRWIKRAKAAREAGEPPPPRRWL